MPDSVPWGGTYVGPDGFRDFLYKLDQAFDTFKATPAKVLGADDNHVIVVAKTKGQAQGRRDDRGQRRLGLPAARRADRGRRGFGDTAQALQALG